MKDKKGLDCPSALELFEYMNSTLPESQAAELKKHVDGCDICSEIIGNLKKYVIQFEDALQNMHRKYEVPQHIAKLAKQRILKSVEAMKQVCPKEIAFGQLWSTKTVEQASQESQILIPRIVIILSEDCLDDSPSSTIVVAPISLELEFQSQYDLTVFEEESPLGYKFMIEIWNQATILVSQLDSYCGSLAEHLKGHVRLLNQVYLGLGGDLSSLSDRIGWPILHENDPRAMFQAQEVEECEYLSEPALREIAIAEKTPVAALEELFDIWFRREDGTLYFAEVKEPEAVAVAAPSKTLRDWFLYAKGKLAGEEIVTRFMFHLLQDELKLKFERIPQVLAYSELLITGYGKSRTKLFSEIVKAEQGESFVVSRRKHVRPHDIEELNITVAARR